MHKIIGMALTNEKFREALLKEPAKTLKEFDLTDEERQVIEAINTEALEEFASSLTKKITRWGDTWCP